MLIFTNFFVLEGSRHGKTNGKVASYTFSKIVCMLTWLDFVKKSKSIK